MKSILVLLIVLSALNPDSVRADSGQCQTAKRILAETRQALRQRNSVKQGNWLNCIKQQAMNAKKANCRKNIINEKSTSLKKELVVACKNKGLMSE